MGVRGGDGWEKKGRGKKKQGRDGGEGRREGGEKKGRGGGGERKGQGIGQGRGSWEWGAPFPVDSHPTPLPLSALLKRIFTRPGGACL